MTTTQHIARVSYALQLGLYVMIVAAICLSMHNIGTPSVAPTGPPRTLTLSHPMTTALPL